MSLEIAAEYAHKHNETFVTIVSSTETIVTYKETEQTVNSGMTILSFLELYELMI